MNKKDYESVLDNMHLQNNIFWPLPICLYISIEKNNRIEPGTSVAIRNQEGYLFAIMHVEDIWPVDIKKEINLLR